MNRGGVETWLMQILRHIDRAAYQIDFLVHTERPCEFDEEIRAYGSRILSCPDPSNPPRYARHFRQIILNHDPYDVIHSHVHQFSGFVLRLAHHLNISTRIAHSHTVSPPSKNGASVYHRLYGFLMNRWIQKHATLGLACSRDAAASLLGETWEQDPRWRVLHCGIDLRPFYQEVDRNQVRDELNIPHGALVIGHVGRFVETKNHDFLIDVFHEFHQLNPQAYLLLVGDGPLQATTRDKARHLGLEQSVIFAGNRPDVPRIMKGAMDLFLFPSTREGLGLALVEAQCAGLPCVISDAIPDEAVVIPEIVTRMPVSSTLGDWTRALSPRITPHRPSTRDCLTRVASTDFNLERSISNMISLYR